MKFALLLGWLALALAADSHSAEDNSSAQTDAKPVQAAPVKAKPVPHPPKPQAPKPQAPKQQAQKPKQAQNGPKKPVQKPNHPQQPKPNHPQQPKAAQAKPVHPPASRPNPKNLPKQAAPLLHSIPLATEITFKPVSNKHPNYASLRPQPHPHPTQAQPKPTVKPKQNHPVPHPIKQGGHPVKQGGHHQAGKPVQGKPNPPNRPNQGKPLQGQTTKLPRTQAPKKTTTDKPLAKQLADVCNTAELTALREMGQKWPGCLKGDATTKQAQDACAKYFFAVKSKLNLSPKCKAVVERRHHHHRRHHGGGPHRRISEATWKKIFGECKVPPKVSKDVFRRIDACKKAKMGKKRQCFKQAMQAAGKELNVTEFYCIRRHAKQRHPGVVQTQMGQVFKPRGPKFFKQGGKMLKRLGFGKQRQPKKFAKMSA